MSDEALDRDIPMAIDSAEFERQRRTDEIRLRALSMQERGRMIEAACLASAEILQGRIQSGLGTPTPMPWPDSTLQFLSKHAPHE